MEEFLMGKMEMGMNMDGIVWNSMEKLCDL